MLTDVQGESSELSVLGGFKPVVQGERIPVINSLKNNSYHKYNTPAKA